MSHAAVALGVRLREALGRWGIPAGLEPREAERLRVTNLYALTAAAIILFAYAPAFAFLLGWGWLVLGTLASAMACALVPLLHAWGFVRWGRYWFVLAANALVFAHSLALGPDSGVHLAFLAAACTPLAIFPERPRRRRYALGAVAIALMSASIAIGRSRPAPIELAPQQLMALEISMCITVLLLLALLILYHVRASEAAAAKLEHLRRLDHAEMDQALRKSEERFRQLVAQAADALLFLDDRGRILDANEQATRDLGYTRTQLICKHISKLDVDGHLVAAMDDLDALQERGHITLECSFRRANGSTYPVEVRMGIVHVEGTRHVLTLARDIEQRRAMEAKLMFADRMVSVGTLAAGVAHEINNPLTYMGMNLEYLRSHEETLVRHLDATQALRVRQAIARALDGNARVATIVRDLKTFARGGSEETAVVDVNDVLASTLSLADGALRRRAEVRTALTDVPGVRGSEARLGQVFLNLVLNAAQAFEGVVGRDPLILVSTRMLEDGTVAIEVRDNGRGIAPEDLARIFDPFFTTKPVGVGTGLGLFICQNIVRSFDGDIEVESESGVGTTVRLRMPPASKPRLARPPVAV